MNHFKSGDKVVFVRDGKIGWESADWAKLEGLELGSQYVIDEVGIGHDAFTDEPQPFVTLQAGNLFALHPDHFELLQ